MPRHPRLVIPGVPLHIRQRGVDRCATFRAPEDYEFFRWSLLEASKSGCCDVHAYVLMPNHIHLLVSPGATWSPARMMRSLGALYVRYFNDRYGRTGTLWEGRYRSTLVDTEDYFFTCSRYIELNPVRAGMFTTPREYNWSSFAHNALGHSDAVLTPHTLYNALGPTRQNREGAYRALFTRVLDERMVAALRGKLRARCQRSLNSDQRTAIRAASDIESKPNQIMRASQSDGTSSDDASTD